MKKAYPDANVRVVIGTLTDAAVIEKEAAAADIVVRKYSRDRIHILKRLKGLFARVEHNF